MNIVDQLRSVGSMTAQDAADEIERLRAAIGWALGDAPDADGKWLGDVEWAQWRGKPAPFGWRRHLRKLAFGDEQKQDGKPYCVHGIADYDLCKVCNPDKGRF